MSTTVLFLCAGSLICFMSWMKQKKKKQPRHLHGLQNTNSGSRILTDVTKLISFCIRFLMKRHTNKLEVRQMDMQTRLQANVSLKIIFSVRNQCDFFYISYWFSYFPSKTEVYLHVEN